MASSSTEAGQNDTLNEILSTLKRIQLDHRQLSVKTDVIGQRVDLLTRGGEVHPERGQADEAEVAGTVSSPIAVDNSAVQSSFEESPNQPEASPLTSNPPRKPSVTSRIILTTYPGQSGVDPIPMDWGNKNPVQRGPVIVSRTQKTVKRRNGQQCPGYQHKQVV